MITIKAKNQRELDQILERNGYVKRELGYSLVRTTTYTNMRTILVENVNEIKKLRAALQLAKDMININEQVINEALGPYRYDNHDITG